MNCPLCGEELDQTGRCPNCGEEPAQMDTEPLEPSKSLPGIFYENLAASRAEEEQERQTPWQPRFSAGERRGLFLTLVLLAAVLTTVWLASRQYDPDAVAMYGNEGISMDNRTFAIYYRSAVAETNNQYSQQKAQPPFDSEGNLERQYINLEEDYSWADYFRQQALEDAALTESLVARANRAGFQPDAEKISAFEATLEQLPAMAAASGYTNKDGTGDAAAYLHARYGPAVTVETYQQYLRDTFLAQSYSDALYRAGTFSDAQLEEYYQAHRSDYTALTKSELPNVDIRQVLYLPGDGEDDAAVWQRAEADLDWLRQQGNTEQAFIELAQRQSADSGSRDAGGLLTNIAPGQLGAEFSSWCFDPQGHAYGDVGIAKSDYGVHLIFFLNYRDNFQWKDQVTEDMRSQSLSQRFSELLEETDCRLTRFALSPPAQNDN